MTALDLLLIEDSEDDAFLIMKELERAGYALACQRVEGRETLVAALSLRRWQLVISDCGLPGFSGAEALAIVRAHDPDVPFILVSGTIGEEPAVDLIRAGASDYVVKDRLHRLLAAVSRELRDAATRKERSALADEVVREKERFSATFQHAPIGIANGSATGILLRVNERFCQLLGYSAEELLGKSIWTFSHPEDLALGRERHARLMSGPQSTETFERRFYRKDRSVMWANVTLSVVKDARGEIDHMIGLVEDISEQRSVRERLGFQARLLDCVEEATVATDLRGRVQYWNHHAEKLYGIEASEALHQRLIDLVVPELEPQVTRALMDEARRGASWSGEFFVRTRDGRRFPIALTNSPILDDDGEATGIVGVSTDISRRYAADQALRESRAQLAMAQQFIRVGSVEQDLVTGRRTWSDAMFRLLGLEVASEPPRIEDLMGFIDEADRERMALLAERAFRDFQPYSADYRVTLRDGRRSEMRSRASIIFDQSGAPAKLLTVVQDITEQKILERELLLHGERHEAIANLSQYALEGLDIAHLLSSAEQFVRAILRSTFCEISTPTSSGLLLCAGGGWPDGVVGRHVSPFDLQVPAGYVLGTGEMVVVEDFHGDDRFLPSALLQDHSVRSALTVAIPGHLDKPWGVLGAYDAAPRAFSADDVNFVRAVANILGSAIQRKRFEEELSARARQQSAIAALGLRAVAGVDGEIINHACTLLREVLHADYSFLLELDAEAQQFTPLGGNLWRPRPDVVIPNTPDSQAGYTLHVDAPVVVADLGTDSRFARASVLARELVSGITVPVRVDGEAFGVLGVHTRTMRRFTDGDVHFVQALANVVADVIQRDRNSRALLDSEARYRSVSRELHLLLQSVEEGVYALRLDGTCRVVNPAAARLLGYEPEELLGRDLHELVHSRRRDGTVYPLEECPVSLVAKDGQSRRKLDETFWRRDGSPLSVEYAAAPIIDDGVITGVVVTFADVSERRKMEARLEQATRLNSLGHLAATMAHEFNNVLMGISPFLDLLNRTEKPTPFLQMATEQMGKAVQRGKGITGEILRFTRSRPPVRETLDVEDWLRTLTTEAATMLGDAHPLAVSVDSPALKMSADGNQLHQCLLNLIVNARDAMPEGGPIVMSVQRDDDSARYAFGAVPAPDRFVHFTVSDEGCGMTEETLSHIFEPLFTTKRNGTGLGLAVTHQVIERHGGHVFVESTLGEGTMFHLFVPLAAASEIAAPALEPARKPHRAGGKVLLVEDEEAVAAGVTVLLEMEAITAITVGTVAEVSDALRMHQPDAVILDIGLPDGDGMAIYEAIADSYPQLPVIFSTGHGDEQKLEPFLARDNVRFLMKPYEFSALLDMLASVGIAPGA